MSQKLQPPKIASRFLQWFCAEELLEEIEGDLHEAFYFRSRKYGHLRAKWLYFTDVIRFFKPYSFEKYSRSKQYIPMVKNYFKIAVRNLLKRKGLTALNMVGLSVGIASVLMVSIYLFHELNYDKHVPESEKVFRMVNQYRDQTYTCMAFFDYYGTTADGQLKLIDFLKNYPEVEQVSHFVLNNSPIGPNDQYYVTAGDKKFVLDDFLFTNTGLPFQEIFPQQFIQGSPENAFADFQKIILTKPLAVRLYGGLWEKEQVIGKSIQISDETFIVGGVVEEMPGNSHFQFSAIVYQATIPSWGAYTYLKVQNPDQIGQVVDRFNAEVDLMYPGRSEDPLQKGVKAVALTDIHFTDGMLYELKPTANQAYLLTFGIVGIIILLIIWTNYTNLAIATYANRQKELGLRKTLGARTKDISNQVMTEAVLITLLSMPVSWLIVYSAMPAFNELLNIGFDRTDLFHPVAFLYLLLILIVTGLISGIYPSVVYSRKSLVGLLEGKLNNVRNAGKLNFRNALLTSQFFMLIVLVSITLIIQQQMNYVQSKEMGFEKEGVVFFEINGAEKYNLLEQQLKQIPEIESVGNGMIPGQDMYNQLTYKMKGTDITFADGTFIYASKGAFDVLEIQSDAFRDIESKKTVFVVNRTAAKKLATAKGISENELVGQTLIAEPEYEFEGEMGYEKVIGGIVEDFDYFNLKHNSQPLLIDVFHESAYVYDVLIKAKTDNWVQTIADIEKAYLSIEKKRPFDITFLDNHLHQIYQKEKNAGILTAGLTGVSMGLAIMGLIGIVGFITFSRQKEIGVRKVFGASIKDILFILNKDYLIMMVIATVIAAPAVIFLANKWLDSFAYHIDPGLKTIGVAGLLTLAIVMMVVISQSVRSARSNPADTLRSE
ncbi:MAG: FtsX-like permease family protein [Bacteroidota bacterium]